MNKEFNSKITFENILSVYYYYWFCVESNLSLQNDAVFRGDSRQLDGLVEHGFVVDVARGFDASVRADDQLGLQNLNITTIDTTNQQTKEKPRRA